MRFYQKMACNFCCIKGICKVLLTPDGIRCPLYIDCIMTSFSTRLRFVWSLQQLRAWNRGRSGSDQVPCLLVLGGRVQHDGDRQPGHGRPKPEGLGSNHSRIISISPKVLKNETLNFYQNEMYFDTHKLYSLEHIWVSNNTSPKFNSLTSGN